MTNLKEVNFGLNQYCGPSVLSILTGKNTDHCAAVISAVSGKRVIKATEIAHLLEATKRLDMVATPIRIIARTLYGLLGQLVNMDGMYMVVVPHHVVAIEVRDKQIYFCDNHTKQPINAAASARLMQEVLQVFKIEPKPQPSKADLTAERIRMLNKRIDDINRQISRLMSERASINAEIESLRGEVNEFTRT